ncbi:MAG: two-component system response regulator [Hyphomicrobiales bacterium]|nr:two-component system response regulator [Hyphomicrobiales bacterium]
MTHVLIVDDSPIIRKVARHVLQTLGFETVEANDGQAGLDACSQTMPDAVLVDSNMPGMDGYEFLRRLRAMPDGRQPKVVFCTTEHDVGHIARAMRAGADDFMMKPFDRDMIAAKFMEDTGG